jgi:hypothetical protein
MKYAATLSLPWLLGVCLFFGFCLEVLRTLITSIYGPLLKRIFPWPWRVDTDRNFIIIWLQKVKRNIADFLATPRTFYGILDFGDKCIHTFVIIISFSYIFVITKAAQIFNCPKSTIENRLIMEASPDYTCFVDNWWWLFPAGIKNH